MLDKRFETLNICVLVPTYNNEKTLKRVLDGILNITTHLIIVNDGSTDSTEKILIQYPHIYQIHLKKNKGKGFALRKGFEEAKMLGYNYAITLDSDGQHFPSDIPLFIEDLIHQGDGIIIGSRNLKQEGVPGKSSFGNRFSNFWFKVETGITMSDTQSGFRLYPIAKLRPIHFFTTKFEFEIEVLVKAAWKGIPVRNIPIQILYDPLERVSHFRPFQDFTRISLLNTYLFFRAFLIEKPKKIIQKLISKP